MKPQIAFFGTPEYSLLVLEHLYKEGFPIPVVVTKPPRKIGRDQKPTPTPVANWASAHQIPLLTPISHPDKPWLFADEENVIRKILSHNPELLITADYTQKIPMQLVEKIKFGGLNVHPSLLPAYRGPAPVPWAILNGEAKTGVSIVTLSEKFDEGRIIAQEKEPILPTDTTDTLLTKLFTKGADLLIKQLFNYVEKFPNYELRTTNYELTPSYFPRLTRDHGFIPWYLLNKAMLGENVVKDERPSHLKLAVGPSADGWSLVIERLWRAFHPWPGLWTKVEVNGEEKRLKLLKVRLNPKPFPLTPILVLDEIQLEGKNPLINNDAAQFLSQLQSG